MTERPACPLNNTGQTEWTEAQAIATDTCYYCEQTKPVRIEPFSQKKACKKDWEGIVYGDN